MDQRAVASAGNRRPSENEWLRRAHLLGRLGLILVPLGIVLFALVPLAEADNRAYAAAPQCPPGTRSDTCRAAVTETVTGKETESSGKSHHYYLHLRGSGEHRVEVSGTGSLYDTAHRGDEATVTYWKDEIRAVRIGGHEEATELSPLRDGRLPAAFAVAALAIGLGGLTFWGAARRRPAAQGDAYPWRQFVGLMAGIFIACAGLPIVLMSHDVGTGLTYTSWSIVPSVLLSAYMCGWSVRRMSRGAARIAPVEPVKRQVLHAAVFGDVPYSRPGNGFMVTGDGPVTATPDPTGHFAAVPLPGTLTVRRVREIRVGDPAFASVRRGEYSLVIECVDGDRPVLVMAGKKDVPKVLGALLAASTDPADYVPND